jgi:hypothetical protein
LITGVYIGDGNYESSSSVALSQFVKQATSIQLTSNVSPSLPGQAVTLTAFIGLTNTTGTITFLDGATVVSTMPVSNGQAIFTTQGLSFGSHSLTAVYSGDNNFAGSKSKVFSQWVGVGSVPITITSKPNPSVAGEMVTFTACGLPGTGTLEFLDSTRVLGTNPSAAGQCSSYSTNALSVGTHSISARYYFSTGPGDGGLATLAQMVTAH